MQIQAHALSGSRGNVDSEGTGVKSQKSVTQPPQLPTSSVMNKPTKNVSYVNVPSGLTSTAVGKHLLKHNLNLTKSMSF